MKLLIASDKFKGSLTAAEACAAIREGFESSQNGAPLEISEIPIADGGEGMARSIAEAKGGDWIEVETTDPLGRPVRAGYGWIPSESLAVIEMAEASGLWRLGEGERDPWRATTFGTGILMGHAIETFGPGEILLGIGGSATNDGGTGMARALGCRFLDKDGGEITDLPAALDSVARIDREAALPIPRVMVACDVTNPLLGENGCTRVY
jgi:glycerate kinase